MCNALTALALGIALEQFANLEKQHDKHGLRELRLCSGQEADSQGSNGSHRHQQMLVEGLSFCYTLHRFLQGIITYY